MKVLSIFVNLTAALWVMLVGVSHASMTYTDSTAFFSALPGPSTTLDFESLSPGDRIASGDTIEGITFVYDFGDEEMQVSDVFDTTSPDNFLGTTDAAVFQDGDDFDLSFAPMNALGMFFLSADTMSDGDIILSAAGITASLDASISQPLPDGSNAFFLGIIDNMSPFTSAHIEADGGPGGPFFVYNVDDITTSVVPLPTSFILFGSALISLAALGRRYSQT